MNLLFVPMTLLCASLALSACGGGATSAPGESGSSTPISRQAAESTTRVMSLENQLKDWWGGPGISITWKVSGTVNKEWDGNSRPDHAPPDGFQGLVQEPFSGPYKDSLEMNYKLLNPSINQSYFVLTPVINIDGQAIELEPTKVKIGATQTLATAGYATSGGDCEDGESLTASLSKNTPRGLLMYDVVMSCEFKVQQILIRNYQKS